VANSSISINVSQRAILSRRPPSIDIRHPLTLKSNDVFLLTEEDGGIPGNVPGFGLFYRDCRYLGHYELLLHDTRPMLLASTCEQGFSARIELTNRSVQMANGDPIEPHALSIQRRLLLPGDAPEFLDAISIRNFGTSPVTLPLSLAFATEFESMFVLRGTPQGKRGEMHAPDWDGTTLRFSYAGADKVLRSLQVGFSEPPIVGPRTTEWCVAFFEFQLAPQESKDLVVSFRIDEQPVGDRTPSAGPAAPSMHALRDAAAAMAQSWREDVTPFTSSDDVLDRVLRHSLQDIRMLQVRRGDEQFTAAGLPWFVALFGRDSLLPTIQCLAYDPDLGARTTRTLAHYQGTKDDKRTNEEPGKILHELRVGEMANLAEVPQTPSYASVDSTLLFLIAIARHATWTGSLALFRELRPNIERALHWMDEREARDGNGYVAYYGKTPEGAPVNQSWRDSGTGVLRADGAFPEPPIMMVEVQGYAYLAQTLMAALFGRSSDAATARRLEQGAAALRERFNRDFWMEDEGCYCLGLEKGGRQIASIASNAAQALWSGIADPEKARRTAERVMRDDMFSGWGVRTLSAKHVRFDPLAYQQGSVWPFDNSLILAGFRRYGLDDAACRVFEGTLAGAAQFRNGRLPEFIAGTQREEDSPPTHTPRADPLQAWSAGAVPYMVTEMLGLHADGFDKRLRVVRPVLPEGIDGVELRDISVAGAAVSLRFQRRSGGAVEGEVVETRGKVDVVFEA
jgi:glycogen debranching enzyme